MITFDPSRPNFAPYGFTCEIWTPAPMKRPDRHNEVELNLLTHGALYYLLAGERVTVEAGRLAVFWAAIPHQIIGSADRTKYFVATLPLTWFLQCQFPDTFIHSILHGRILFTPDAGHARSDAELFGRWVGDLESNDPSARRAVQLELEARLLRFSLSIPEQKQPEHKPRVSHALVGAGGLNRVEQMASFIAQNYTRKITAEEISRAVGLHPNYAMSLFRKTFGLSLIEYVIQHRVSHAQRLLVATDSKVVDIAMASGFNSVSRFNDAFKKACNCSPRQYRDSHRLSAK